MTDPVARLEAWCNRELSMAEGALRKGLVDQEYVEGLPSWRLATACQAIIAEYREAEFYYTTSLDTYFEGAKHALYKIVTILD
jgi:hypothetical protein